MADEARTTANASARDIVRGSLVTATRRNVDVTLRSCLHSDCKLVPRDKRVNLFSERANERTTILDALWIRYGCQISRDRNYIAAPKKYTLKVSSSRSGLSSVPKNSETGIGNWVSKHVRDSRFVSRLNFTFVHRFRVIAAACTHSKSLDYY